MSENVITGWKAASTYTGRSATHLRRLVTDGQLSADQDDQGRYLFKQTDLDALKPQEARGGKGVGAVSGATDAATPTGLKTRKVSPELNALEHDIYGDLARGVPLAEICISHGVDPTWLAARAHAWRQMNAVAESAHLSAFEQLEDENQALRAQVERLEQRVAHLESEYQLMVVLLDSMAKSRM